MRSVAVKKATEINNPASMPPEKPIKISPGFDEREIVDRKRTISNPSRKTAVKTSINNPDCFPISTEDFIFERRCVLYWAKYLCKKKTAQVIKMAEVSISIPSINSSVLPV